MNLPDRWATEHLDFWKSFKHEVMTGIPEQMIRQYEGEGKQPSDESI